MTELSNTLGFLTRKSDISQMDESPITRKMYEKPQL